MRVAVALSVCLFVAAGACAAQTSSPAPKPLAGSIASHPEWPKANPADVATVDALMKALYDVISGPAGKPRDWDRFRSLFAPDGRMGVVRPARAADATHPASGGDVVFLTPEMYVERDDPYFKANGFFERGIANRVEEFGELVNVWSTYESRHHADDAKPFARGLNSLQLVKAQGRYWIASIVWDEEREGLTLPEKYLRDGR
jgi:hypothetical protein